MKRKLNLGCGTTIKKGWVNADIAPLPGVDAVMDIDKTPWKFKANQFNEVETFHTLEHIANFMEVMAEIHRVCEDGAIVKVSVPYFASPAYWRDPTHKRGFNIDTFVVFTNGEHYYTKARFKRLKRKLFYFSCRSFMKSRWYSLPFDLLINLCQPIYQRFFVYALPASEVHFILQVEKKN
jgi:SAM-dependent methyltransferase